MQLSYGMTRVFEKIPFLKHGNDGLIFTPVKHPYVCGACENLLKWKPANKNTVDFKIQVNWNKDRKPGYRLMISDSGIHKAEDHLTLDSE